MTNSNLFIKRSIKSAASVLPFGAGSRVTSGSINIFAYHRVVKDIEKAEREAIYGIVISADTFRHHCAMLKRSFDVVSLVTAAHFLESKLQVSRPLAVLTFDDGYRDFYDVAFPILNDLGLPATVFVPTAQIGGSLPLAHDRIYWLLKQSWERRELILDAIRMAGITQIDTRTMKRSGLLHLTNKLVYLPNAARERVIATLEQALGNVSYPDEYRLLDWTQIKEMERKGISFGAHTANHVVLPLEDHETRVTEIESSKRVLEEQLGRKVISFAYPNGEYNPEIIQITKDAGFKVAVTTENRINLPGADRFRLGRASLCEESTRGIRGTYSVAVANLRLGV